MQHISLPALGDAQDSRFRETQVFYRPTSLVTVGQIFLGNNLSARKLRALSLIPKALLTLGFASL